MMKNQKMSQEREKCQQQEKEQNKLFFRESAWTTSKREVLGSRTLNLLPCSLAVTRKGPINFGARLQDRSGERFMPESPTSRIIGGGVQVLSLGHLFPRGLQFLSNRGMLVWKLWRCNLKYSSGLYKGEGDLRSTS